MLIYHCLHSAATVAAFPTAATASIVAFIALTTAFPTAATVAFVAAIVAFVAPTAAAATAIVAEVNAAHSPPVVITLHAGTPLRSPNEK